MIDFLRHSKQIVRHIGYIYRYIYIYIYIGIYIGYIYRVYYLENGPFLQAFH